MSLFDKLHQVVAPNIEEIQIIVSSTMRSPIISSVTSMMEEKKLVVKYNPCATPYSIDTERTPQESIYYLPWRPDQGIYISLPKKISSEPKVFLTANLNGCFVGFRVDENGIWLCHNNFKGAKSSYNFNLYSHWVAPNKLRDTAETPNDIKLLFSEGQNVTYYNIEPKNTSEPAHFVSVFGLYNDKTEKWMFYLNDPYSTTKSIQCIFEY